MRYCRAIAALFVLAWAWPASAGETRGVIVRVDVDRCEVQVETRGLGRRGLGMTLHVGKDTKILFGREAGELSDLVPGKRVRVVYDGDRAVSLHLFGLRPARNEVRPGPREGLRPAPAPAPTDPNTVTGVLRRVSYAEHEVVVVSSGEKGGEKETIISVPKDARVFKDGKPLAFDDLKDGQPASIQTEKRDGKLLAKNIQVGTGAAAASVPAEMETRPRLARIRRLLQLADRILEMAEGAREEPPQPKEPPK